MRLTISGKQMDLTDGIKNSINEKLGRLDHYLHPETEMRVTVSAKKSRQKVEVTIIPISGPIIHAEDREEDLYAAMDVVYDKLNTQLRKYKSKLQDKHQQNSSIRYNVVNDNDDEIENININFDIERNKTFDVKPMSAEEAALQLELIGHDFYIFKNIDNDSINVIYKRENGGYGLIEHQ